LEFHKDSTFRFDWRFDLIHNWATGEWTTEGKTIILEFINVYDTLTRMDKPDSLVLSIHTEASRINEQEFAMAQLISSGQSNDGITTRLKKKGNRLYLLDEKGQTIKK